MLSDTIPNIISLSFDADATDAEMQIKTKRIVERLEREGVAKAQRASALMASRMAGAKSKHGLIGYLRDQGSRDLESSRKTEKSISRCDAEVTL